MNSNFCWCIIIIFNKYQNNVIKCYRYPLITAKVDHGISQFDNLTGNKKFDSMIQGNSWDLLICYHIPMTIKVKFNMFWVTFIHLYEKRAWCYWSEIFCWCSKAKNSTSCPFSEVICDSLEAPQSYSQDWELLIH